MKCRIPEIYKPPMSGSMVKRKIRAIMEGKQMPENSIAVVTHLFDFMIGQKYYGGCHALSSALYVALCELGLAPELFIGECRVAGIQPFDHSWVILDGEVIDLAVYYPLTQVIGSMGGPVIMGIDAISARPTRMEYGVNTGLPLSPDTMTVLSSTFGEYMDKFPMGRDGLWSMVMSLLPNSMVTADELREKYKDVKRIFMR